ncbi:kynureninase [Mucilaginibacter sp. PPCGB 2223]|uniref:kynureninase n=1 Tax=Mucilaginibacter sp. PPCGB 2223 TaxID=1886027 RepID=UPI0008250265|nr:kynureninase [Mucilaginibacter sp. PPCGB 2223]OCX53784.1 kynureninase [Mucilaginibacter sp. PPCGB 2223]
MNYQNTLEFALAADKNDPLARFRDQFIIPQHNRQDMIYLCGNSLGLQPKATAEVIAQQLSNWSKYAVEGWFDGDTPWMFYHKTLTNSLATIVGALPAEVVAMNTLTVNLHFLLVSFYKPNQKRFKIIMEGGAFPSDQYAVESQVRFHGYDPMDAIIEVFPRQGEDTLRTEDILQRIHEHADELALVLFGGINYYTGQFYNLQAITKAGHDAGAIVGFDLAHAAGNVPLRLHDWNVDFACWCSYKYMNSGPGGISGAFVHQKHFGDATLNRFAGWWGYREDTRFEMKPGFKPQESAEGWMVSCSPVLLLAAHAASLKAFAEVGSMQPLRDKSKMLTGYLEFLIRQMNRERGNGVFKIITPADPAQRGAQLSVICDNGKAIFDYLVKKGVLGDWREPDVIRLSPVPLYNSFADVYMAGKILKEAVSAIQPFPEGRAL